MNRKSSIIWGSVSFAGVLIGLLWRRFDPGNGYGFLLYFLGWMSSLLAVGYVSTPSDSTHGKIAFGFVVLLVTGIAMKLLHLILANEIILAGVLGILITYVAMWFGKKG
jgi:hypothetical protein